MIPYSYNMVDMGGIDLAEANGTIVPGVYERITEAMNLCGDVILYNWKFAAIDIVPSAYTILQQSNSILINSLIQVTELDQVTVIGLPPPLVPVVPLEVTENGLYEAELPASGFNPVRVTVPERVPVIESISITENGTYNAPEGVDGFSPISVSVGGDDWVNLKNYIESSGTQYINTGYSPAANTKFEVIANAPDNSTNYPCLIGERTSPQNEVVIYTEFNGGSLGLVWANGDAAAISENVRQYCIGHKCKYVLGGDGLRGVLNANGYGFVFVKAIGTFATLPIFIFVLNDNGRPNSVTYCSAKLYRFCIYEGDTLVHEYLPWQESGVACLKDTVSGNILYNSGTGNFVYGTDQ